jgi:2-aminoethylphosphonate transport system permease protein
VLLLDEPLSALDAQIRRSMVEEIARLHADLPGLTILYVTHDQSEALTLADRIAILKDGALSAIGRTSDLYRRPPNRFAAEFLGRANLLPVIVEEGAAKEGLVAVRAGGDRLVVASDGAPSGVRRLLCVRPQHLTLTAEHTALPTRLAAVCAKCCGRANSRISSPKLATRSCELSRPDCRRCQSGARRSTSFLRPPTPASFQRKSVSDLAVRAAPARLNFNGLWIAPPLIVLGLTFLYPLVLIARAALVGDAGEIDVGGFVSVLHSRAFLNALINTGLIALAATAGCLALGVTLALILAFVPFPGSTFVARLIDTFIALPTFLVTLAFTFLYGSAGMLNGALTQSLVLSEPPVHFLYSAWGVILAEVTVYTPFVLRPLLAAFSLVDQSQIEVAGLLGARPWRIVRSVILPAALSRRDRWRQSLSAIDRQRVRDRAVHRRQGRHHAAALDL